MERLGGASPRADRQEPEPGTEATLTLGGKKVSVPQGKPVAQKECESSSFHQSEYLLYSESQVQMRYMLKIKFR